MSWHIHTHQGFPTTPQQWEVYHAISQQQHENLVNLPREAWESLRNTTKVALSNIEDYFDSKFGISLWDFLEELGQLAGAVGGYISNKIPLIGTGVVYGARFARWLTSKGVFGKLWSYISWPVKKLWKYVASNPWVAVAVILAVVLILIFWPRRHEEHNDDEGTETLD